MTYSIVIINYLTTKKNQTKKKNQVSIPGVVMEITTILTIFGMKRRTTILTKIENCGSLERQNWTTKMGRRNFM